MTIKFQTFLLTTHPYSSTNLMNAQNMKFSIKDFFSKCDQILNRKLHFLCSVRYLTTRLAGV